MTNQANPHDLPDDYEERLAEYRKDPAFYASPNDNLVAALARISDDRARTLVYQLHLQSGKARDSIQDWIESLPEDPPREFLFEKIIQHIDLGAFSLPGEIDQFMHRFYDRWFSGDSF